MAGKSSYSSVCKSGASTQNLIASLLIANPLGKDQSQQPTKPTTPQLPITFPHAAPPLAAIGDEGQSSTDTVTVWEVDHKD